MCCVHIWLLILKQWFKSLKCCYAIILYPRATLLLKELKCTHLVNNTWLKFHTVIEPLSSKFLTYNICLRMQRSPHCEHLGLDKISSQLDCFVDKYYIYAHYSCLISWPPWPQMFTRHQGLVCGHQTFVLQCIIWWWSFDLVRFKCSVVVSKTDA